MDKENINSPTIAAATRPAPVWLAVLLFAGSSLLFFFFLYVVLPLLQNAGVSWFLSYVIVWVLPMALLLTAALTGYRLEGHPFSWPAMQQRFRLGALNVNGWIWAVALSCFLYRGSLFVLAALALGLGALFMESKADRSRLWISMAGMVAFFIFSFALWKTEPWLTAIPLHGRPEILLDYFKHFEPTVFMGIPMAGQGWLLIFMLLVLSINIAGEELWWRGYILPRQELALGNKAWIVHGILLAFFHLFFQFTLYDLVAGFPSCFALAFVAQRSRNTWPGIIGHTVGNSTLLVYVVRGVLL